MAEKKTKVRKDGKPRKTLPSGTQRISLFLTKTKSGIDKIADRTNRWSEKTAASVQRDMLKTIAHLMGECLTCLDKAIEKSDAITESGWHPPTPSQVASRKSFAVGEIVQIKNDYAEHYKLFDRAALKSMKIASELKSGKHTSYFVPGVGVIPKSHLESVTAA